jgi:hypothetical protein
MGNSDFFALPPPFLLLPSFDFLCRIARKPFNPQLLISHLTNSNRCGNIQPRFG